MDKETIPTDQEAPKTPELQETLENAEAEESVESVKTESTAKEEVIEPASDEATPAEDDNPAKKPGSILESATIEPVKKDHNKVAIIVLAVALVLCLGIGVFAIIMMNKQKDPFDKLQNTVSSIIDETEEKLAKEKKELEEKKAKEQEEKEAKEKEEQEKKEKEAKEKEEAEKKAKEEAEKKKNSTGLKPVDIIEELQTALNKVAGTGAYGAYSINKEARTTIYQPLGYKTAIMLKGYELNSGSGSTEDVDNSVIAQAIVDTLEAYGFEKTETYTFSIGFSDDTYYNARNNIVCSVEKRQDIVLEGYPVSCASTTSYDLEDKSLVNSLAEAYKKSEGDYPTYINGTNTYNEKLSDTISNTGYKEYQTIIVSTGENAGMVFYRESPSKEWIYLTATQAAIDCSEYSSELKKGLASLCESN